MQPNRQSDILLTEVDCQTGEKSTAQHRGKPRMKALIFDGARYVNISAIVQLKLFFFFLFLFLNF